MVTQPIGAFFAKVDTGVTTGIPPISSSKNMVQPNSHGEHSRRREIAECAQPMA
jgi:hypothetical protein